MLCYSSQGITDLGYARTVNYNIVTQSFRSSISLDAYLI